MDYPDDTSNHDRAPMETPYPDIDEVFHYPWQGSQQTVAAGDSSLASVIDPRLYKDLFPSNVPQQQSLTDDADEFSSIPGELQRDADGSSDQLYEYSGEESTDDEYLEMSDEDEETGGPSGDRLGARGGKGVKRGPRKPLDPGPVFKDLHSRATSAFIDSDYKTAIELVTEAIQINPEIFAAHALLSEILLAQGEKDKALTALFTAAHTRPRDPSVWSKVARMILDRAGDDRQSALNGVIYCYSRVLDIDPKNLNARFQRAAIYRELRQNGRAASEYERLLKEIPHNARALRHLAEIYIDLNDVQKAVNHYSNSVNYYLSREPEEVPDFSWSDVNIYAELYGYVGQYEKGITAIKTLSRWLLGRRDDTMWDSFDDDDREWDADDFPRRIKTDGYIPDQWPRDSYGMGLPLELRAKLGLFRLKIGHEAEALVSGLKSQRSLPPDWTLQQHFEWLSPDDTSEGAPLYDYGDLFREVADSLKQAALFEEALRFYVPVQETSEYADVSFFLTLGECYLRLNRLDDAENCYLIVTEHDARNVESRVQLAKLYERIGMKEEAFKYVNEAVLLERQSTRSRRRGKDTRLDQLAMEYKTAELAPDGATMQATAPIGLTGGPAPAFTTRVTPLNKKSRQEAESERTENVKFLYSKMIHLQPLIKEGNADATEDWLDIADALLHDFRSNRIFYPTQRSVVFLGYSREAQKGTGRQKSRPFMDEMRELAGRLQESLGTSDVSFQDAVPTDYHGLAFDQWLDIFLQYSLLVAEQGENEEAYETLAAAVDASVFYHSKRKTRLIHVCWFTCALRMQDEETLTNEARWFIKEYQFVTDSYRIFAILSRLSGNPHRSLFHSSPNMKFMLRQIKAMDFSLSQHMSQSGPARTPRQPRYHERVGLSSRNEMGEVVAAEEMDVALLMLYGHILYSGNSFYPALNYFFRAYALDPENPAVLLSIAVSYIHQSLKRQSENRHYLIMEGLSFMYEYRRVREKEGTLLQERQEMEFNFARVYHMLGLAHLAVEGYHKVLELGEQIQIESQKARGQIPGTDGLDIVMGEADVQQPFVEDFSSEAAVALQTIYALSGDLKAAKDITEKWLVI